MERSPRIIFESQFNRLASISQEKEQIGRIYFKLQELKAKFSANIRVPQLVVFGAQSAGKSTFLEALLGFRFNNVGAGLTTRRPLLIQMERRPGQETPLIYFTNNNGEEDPIPHTPEQCGHVIGALTDEQLRAEGKQDSEFSSKQIIMRVVYAHCSNVCLIDTPGLRQGDTPAVRTQIEDIIAKFLEDDTTIPVYIQNSGINWANSFASNQDGFLRRFDPDLSRTVVCITKFDELLVQSKTKNEVVDFMNAQDSTMRGLRPIMGYNFVSIGAAAFATPNFLNDIRAAAERDIERMLAIGFTPEEIERYNYGIYHFIERLEHFLFDKIRQTLAPALADAQSILESRTRENEALNKQLGKLLDPSAVQQILSALAGDIGRIFEEVLSGTAEGWENFGRTLTEDFEASISASWFTEEKKALTYLDKSSTSAKLVGGAAINRSLEWIKIHCALAQFPDIHDNDVRNAFGLSPTQNTPVAERAAAVLLIDKGKDKGIARAILGLHDLMLGILNRTLEATIHLVLEKEPLLSSMKQKLHQVLSPYLSQLVANFKQSLVEVYEFLKSFGVMAAADQQFPPINPAETSSDPDDKKLADAVLGVGSKSVLAAFLQQASVKHPTSKELAIIKRGVQVMFHYVKLKFVGLIDYQVGKLRRELYEGLHRKLTDAVVVWVKVVDVNTLLQGSQEMGRRFKENQNEIDIIHSFITDLESEVRKVQAAVPNRVINIGTVNVHNNVVNQSNNTGNNVNNNNAAPVANAADTQPSGRVYK